MDVCYLKNGCAAAVCQLRDRITVQTAWRPTKGTRVVFDAHDIAADGTWQVKGSSGQPDTGLRYYRTRSLSVRSEDGDEVRQYGPMLPVPSRAICRCAHSAVGTGVRAGSPGGERTRSPSSPRLVILFPLSDSRSGRHLTASPATVGESRLCRDWRYPLSVCLGVRVLATGLLGGDAGCRVPAPAP